MAKKYYKVVDTNSHNEYCSAYINSLGSLNKLLVIYKIGEWAYPKIDGTNLMVFSNKWSAYHFMDSYWLGNRIFECEVINPRKIGVFVKGNPNMMEKLKPILLLKKSKKKYSNLCCDAPKGTIFCSAVKLIKEVKR